MQHKAIIVGGGLAGLAAAISISLAGFTVVVLEQATRLEEVTTFICFINIQQAQAADFLMNAKIGAGIEIPPNASKILAAWGILGQLEKNAIHASNILIRSYQNGTILSKANLIPLCRNLYGFPHLSVHRADFQSCLRKEAERLGTQIRLGVEIVDIDFSDCKIVLKSGESCKADIIVGCDGARSLCREMLLGRPDSPDRSGDIVYRVVLPIEDIAERYASPSVLVLESDVIINHLQRSRRDTGPPRASRAQLLVRTSRARCQLPTQKRTDIQRGFDAT